MGRQAHHGVTEMTVTPAGYRDHLERELELAEATLREIRRTPINRFEPGWVTNLRATIYAVEAEVRRLGAMLDEMGPIS